MRVFSDKLVDKKDKSWFSKELFVVLESYTGKFGADIDKLQNQPPVYFVDFLQEPGLDPVTEEPVAAPRIYEPISETEFGNCKKMAMDYMSKFNNAFKLLK